MDLTSCSAIDREHIYSILVHVHRKRIYFSPKISNFAVQYQLIVTFFIVMCRHAEHLGKRLGLGVFNKNYTS